MIGSANATLKAIWRRLSGVSGRVVIPIALVLALGAAVASFAYLSSPGSGNGTVVVGTFTGPLNHFLVEASAGGNIGSQTTGTPFSVRITAQDSDNHTVTSFTGTIDITSNLGTCNVGCTTTAAFTAGVLSSHSITLTQAGTLSTITATDHAGTGTTGTSNAFSVVTSDAAAPTATIAFPANGSFNNAAGFNTGCTPTGICWARRLTRPASKRSTRRSSKAAATGGAAAASTRRASSSSPRPWPRPTRPRPPGTFRSACPPTAADTVHVQTADTVGNAQSGTTYAATSTFTIDTTRPTVSSINRQAGATNPTNVGPLVFTVTFSESVNAASVVAGRFAATTSNVTGTAPVVGTITPVSPSGGFATVYTVNVTTTGAVGANSGSVRLDLFTSAGSIADQAGNALTALHNGDRDVHLRHHQSVCGCFSGRRAERPGRRATDSLHSGLQPAREYVHRVRCHRCRNCRARQRHGHRHADELNDLRPRRQQPDERRNRQRAGERAATTDPARGNNNTVSTSGGDNSVMYDATAPR